MRCDHLRLIRSTGAQGSGLPVWGLEWPHRAGTVRGVHAKNVRLTAPAQEVACTFELPHSTVTSATQQHTRDHGQPCGGSQEQTAATQASGLTLRKRYSRERVLGRSPWAELIAWSEDDTRKSLNYTTKWPHVVLHSARIRQHFALNFYF